MQGQMLQPHLIVHAVGICVCFAGMLMALFGLAGKREVNGPTLLGGLGIAVLIVGGAIAVGPLVV